MTYKIYKATNKFNGKVYIGLTCKTLDERKNAHKRKAQFGSLYYFHCAIRKYGIDGFDWEILHDNITLQSDADALEIKEIEKFKSTAKKNGYNLSTGGGGGDTFTNNPRKEEIREYLRKINTGKKLPQTTRDKMSKKLIGNTHTLGHVPTQEHRDKISKANMGHKSLTAGKTLEEVYGVEKSQRIQQKISDSLIGRTFSKEHRDKIGNAHRGKILSEETKEKLRVANVGKIPPTAKLNQEIVKEIRNVVFPSKPDNMSWNNFYKELSHRYNISVSVIRKIRYNFLWKNIH